MQRRYSSAIAPSSRSVEQAQFITVPCADGQAVKALQTLSPEFNQAWTVMEKRLRPRSAYIVISRGQPSRAITITEESRFPKPT